jgi:hypothetical protein
MGPDNNYSHDLSQTTDNHILNNTSMHTVTEPTVNNVLNSYENFTLNLEETPFIHGDDAFVHTQNYPQPHIYQGHKINYTTSPSNNSKITSLTIVCAVLVVIFILIKTDILDLYFSGVLAGGVSHSDQKVYLQIHEEIQAQVEDNLISEMPDEISTHTASTYDEFINILYKQMMLRNRRITINYTGSDYQQIVSAFENKSSDNTASELTSTIYNIDDKATSDDCDYLRGNIHSISCEAAQYGDRVKFVFKVEWIESAIQQKYVNNYTSLLIEKLNLRNIPNKEKQISIVHDYLATIITYDTISDNNDKDYSEHSAYSGLAKNSTVCSGYALLNYKILTDLGINCRYVTSKTHGWNIVELNNKWYHIDITWDDTNDNINRRFYLKGDATWESKKEHITEDIYKTSEFLGEYPLSRTDY